MLAICPIRREYLFKKSKINFLSFRNKILMHVWLIQGKNTSKSDVWSFAITFWEIITFAREQPFEELPDHRIVENATFFYQEDDRRVSKKNLHSVILVQIRIRDSKLSFSLFRVLADDSTISKELPKRDVRSNARMLAA